ncbi:MAG: gluconokinase [Massilia sp.]|nr:gluconokinase [Massilia sp.]
MDTTQDQSLAATRWVVMGVSGCGKSEIARLLAARLDVAYAEGDDYHSPANVAKMAAGNPLTDADRQQWLLTLQAKIAVAVAAGDSLVLSCSSLKRRYRDLFRAADPAIVFVHLDGPRELIAARMLARPDHYMPMSLLDSQFAALEPLQPDERGIRLDIHAAPAQLVDAVVQRFAPDCTP